MATLDEMDQAAVEAEKDLKGLTPQSVKEVAEWWMTYFKKAGHKRLGRLLVSYAREDLELEVDPDKEE